MTCEGCKHFRPARRPTAAHLGECRWQPPCAPPWLRDWVDMQDPYYGPQREIGAAGSMVEECEVRE